MSAGVEKEDARGPHWRQHTWIQGEKGRKVALDLFESFVAQERGPVAQEVLGLLSTVLVDNLSDVEWQQFVFQVIKKFLAHPVSLRTTPAEQLYSHMGIIDALDQISIPIGEVL